MSSKGDPGGNWNGKGLVFVTTVWVVEIFTTDGINLSAKSAKDPGIVLECEFWKTPKVIKKKLIINFILFILTLHQINNYKSNYSKN